MIYSIRRLTRALNASSCEVLAAKAESNHRHKDFQYCARLFS